MDKSAFKSNDMSKARIFILFEPSHNGRRNSIEHAFYLSHSLKMMKYVIDRVFQTCTCNLTCTVTLCATGINSNRLIIVTNSDYVGTSLLDLPLLKAQFDFGRSIYNMLTHVNTNHHICYQNQPQTKTGYRSLQKDKFDFF